ncbi:MAG: transketolase [Clostridia bacterium]|nr:transketolase [Clostridia bacterium]
MYISDDLNVKTIRILSAEAVEKANSGHPGLPLGAAPMAYSLWSRHLKHNPGNSKWLDRDRFVLSAGHGSMLLYSLLHIFGYDVTIEDIKNFRQVGSRTPGHPEYRDTDGVETTTGPLGQGVANAAGMAAAEAFLASKFNRENFNIVDHYTYVLAGDGCLMEGLSSEASSWAGTMGLGKLIMLYDSNSISIEGSTDLAFKEDVSKRYEAYGWQVIKVSDGNDLNIISAAIEEAKNEKEKPSLIIVKTIIGEGSPKKQGTASAHGEPLGSEQLQAVKDYYSWGYPEFTVPAETQSFREEMLKKGKSEEDKWDALFTSYKEKYPELADEFNEWYNGNVELSEKLVNDESFWNFEKDMATREASGICIERLVKYFPNLIGGSADLAPSNKTYMKDRGDFSKENKQGANIRFGVREHAMSAIANGIALHGGLKVFTGTFFTFTDYMKAGMRLSAIMKLPVTYVLTHDSIGVGEDGPTHQPVEHLAALRSMPGMITFRPADAKETAAGWIYSATISQKPVSLMLSRQKLPILKNSGGEALKGAYIVYEPGEKETEGIIMASGSEVSLAINVAETLFSEGIYLKVISFPSFELFEEQSDEYKNMILPENIEKRIAIEAASSFGWHKYTGLKGKIFSIDTFGASGKAEDLFVKYGFEKNHIANEIKKYLK